MGRRMVRAGPEKPLEPRPRGHRDAVRRRRRRRPPRRAERRRPRLVVHRLAGPAADDPESLQDRGRAASVRAPRDRTLVGHARALDLLRPRRRHGLSPDRRRDALRQHRARSARFLRHRPRRHTPHARAVPALLRRLPHLARSPEDQPPLRRRPPRAPAAGCDRGVPPKSAHARPSVHPRHGAKPRCVLPGPRGGQQVLRRRSRRRAGALRQLRRPHRPRLQAL